MSEHRFTNALAHETSPYLLQHAHNPVHWYPWGEEALKRARVEDKPILLSIGYSACHWCHVMERESFENEQIAELMNHLFVNIKVDREERPDLDAIYMTAVQMMTGSGGWPMTVFLTPDQVPFYGGTYFPPEERHGMPAFPRVLMSVAHAYREKKEAILADAASVVAELGKTGPFSDGKTDLSREILEAASSGLISNYDARHGGFGHAPKFPPSMALTFLLRAYRQTGQQELLEVVEHTLQNMAGGGIYDQIGGGFHRYSVDDHWLVPHFEKMLYDNALLSRIYLDAWLLTGVPLYRRISEETLNYVLREMTSPEGGFYSSQDADSEGHEGRFYVWTKEEIEKILGEKAAEPFCRYFGVSEEGNFDGRNILSVPRPAELVARLSGVSLEHLKQAIERGRQMLYEEREHRVTPGRDDKMLTAWNALMLRSFAEAANGFDSDAYRKTAVRNAEFLLKNLRRDGRLLRACRDGRSRFNAYLEDYACLVDALLSVYEATFDPAWFAEAQRLAEDMILRFEDPGGRGFYFTADDHEMLIRRPIEHYDNATPSGNSVAAFALLRMWRFTGKDKWLAHARPVLETMAQPMMRHPSAFSNHLCALDFLLDSREIAVVGDPGEEQTRKLLREVFHRYLPGKVVACGSGNIPPLLEGRSRKDGLPAAYVCENFACKTPVTASEELGRLLASGDRQSPVIRQLRF